MNYSYQVSNTVNGETQNLNIVFPNASAYGGGTLSPAAAIAEFEQMVAKLHQLDASNWSYETHAVSFNSSPSTESSNQGDRCDITFTVKNLKLGTSVPDFTGMHLQQMSYINWYEGILEKLQDAYGNNYVIGDFIITDITIRLVNAA